MRRGQLSTSLLEAGLGVLLVFGVAAGFLVGAPAAPADDGQLDLYAEDAATALATANRSQLRGLAGSPEGFATNREAVRARLDALLPANVLYRVETPRGALGFPPADGPEGRARVPTRAGDVVVRVWYA